MIDMELFELMKVTLKEVLRAELTVVLRDRQPHMTIAFPSDKLIADRAFEYAQSAKLRLERHRPSVPVHDPHAATIPPPALHKSGIPCATIPCNKGALQGSDYCEDHQG